MRILCDILENALNVAKADQEQNSSANTTWLAGGQQAAQFRQKFWLKAKQESSAGNAVTEMGTIREDNGIGAVPKTEENAAEKMADFVQIEGKIWEAQALRNFHLMRTFKASRLTMFFAYPFCLTSYFYFIRVL